MALRLHPVVNNLRRAPGFTALVVLTLALGVGATTAMFSVVDAVLIRPLPFPHADRISEIWTYFEEGAARMPGSTSVVVSTVRQERDLFDLVAAYQFGSGTLTGTPEPEMLSFASLSPDIFGIFPTAPVVGRLFTAADATSGDAVILISEALWARHFGRDPAVIDQVVMIEEAPQRIVGVLPSRFKFPEGADAWRPVDITSANARARVQLVVLRRPGVTVAHVNDRLKVLTVALRESGAVPKGQYLISDVPVQVRVGRDSAKSFYLLFGAVTVLLLVACINVTNLMLVRASSRAGELALMSAIGAGRGRLLREAAMESAVLALLGCGLGLWMATGLLDVILAVTPDQLRLLNRVTGDLDWRAVGFAITITAATCLAFGILPAWRASRIDPIDALKQQSRATIGRHDDWWQGALVSMQIALVVVLLAGAGLLLRSFINLNRVDLGFRSDGLALIDVQLTAPRYTPPGAAVRFMREVESRVESQLGMAAAIASSSPIRFGVFVDAHPEAEGLTVPQGLSLLPTARVAPDFFGVFGIPVVAGSTFEPSDRDDTVIVNEVLARRFWGTASPVGRRFRIDSDTPWMTVVGVAGDVKARGPADAMGDGMEVYRPLDIAGRSNFLTLIVDVGPQLNAALPSIKRILWDVDPHVPILSAASVAETIGESISRERFVLSLSGAFTICAVLIAAVGVYGVSAYWVARRRRELAIRMALGASGHTVMGLVVRRSLRWAIAGAAVGLSLAIAGMRVIESMLFQTSSRDPVTLIAVTGFLTALVVLACMGPAFSASRVDPMQTLRAE